MSEPARPRRFVGKLMLIAALVGVPVAIAGAGYVGHGHCGGAVASAEDLRDRMDRHTDRALGRVDATDAQRTAVEATLDALAPQLFALQDEKKALHEDARDVLGAKTIDRAELEALRKDGLALADEASALAVDAVWKIASALTVEQRQELLADTDRWHR